MNKKWVNIRIETKSREFLSKTLIAYDLVQNGYGVVITNKFGIDGTIFPKGAYLINSLFANGYRYIQNLKSFGHKVLFLDEEGLVYINENRYVSRVDPRSLKLIDRVCCFGDDQARIIRENFPEDASKVVVTGNPRMNLLNEYLRPILFKDVQSVGSGHKNYILVVSNFSIANLEGGGSTLEEKRKITANLLNVMGVNQKEEFNDHFDYIYATMHKMMDLIVALSKRFPNETIIVRPHPSEDVTTWQKFAEPLPNVEVIREGTMNPWLLNADLVLENNCTSAIESMFMHVPCISYRPMTDPRFDQPLPNLLSKNVFTEEEAVSIVEKILSGSEVAFDFETYETRSKAYIATQHMDDSVKALRKCIDELDIQPEEYSVEEYNRRAGSLRRLSYRLKGVAKKIVRALPGWLVSAFPAKVKAKCLTVKQDNSMSKFGNIRAKDVEEVFAQIRKLKNDDTAFAIKQIGDEILIYQ